MKKIIIISWIFFIILSMFSNVLATELKTKLNIIKQNSETVYLDDNQGYITKKIVDSNSDIGEVTVELGLSNIRNVSNEEKKNYEDTEIYIIVNENLSHSEEDLNKYISYIETLVTKIFEKIAIPKLVLLE